MASNPILKKEFSENWQKYYDLPVFKERGFQRKQCKQCGNWFWTADENRNVCGDCEDYQFIGNKLQNWDLIETWMAYEKFFKKNNHASIKRYPVVAKWNPNLDFTIASIVDFQRIEKNGTVFSFPEKRLVVPQFCLRFGDIGNVGVTGRHLTGFIMAGQHAYDDYWINECTRLNMDFLTKVVGLDLKEITYSEDVWAMPDLSVYGPCLETFARGLELSTNVFMQFRNVNGKREELSKKVIDVGWGLERITWFVNGSNTLYDSVFGDLIEEMKKQVSIDEDIFNRYSLLAGRLNIDEVKNVEGARKKIAEELEISIDELMKNVEPMQAIYAIADHSRSLLMAIYDGMLPSNVGGGYNLRVIFRRAQALIDKHGFDFDMGELAERHAEYLYPLYPELIDGIEDVKKILEVEKKKYYSSLEKTKKFIKNKIREDEEVSLEQMKKMYEENGVTPDLIREIVPGAKVPDSEQFYTFISEEKKKNKKNKEEKETEFNLEFNPTEKLFYDDVFEFKAYVKDDFEKKGKHYIILDRTAFYPTSGGQEHDTGFIDNLEVVDVFKVGDVIVHEVRGRKLQKGSLVLCKVDRERRQRLAKMHTATHVINGAAKRILGNHVWQAGAEKKTSKAHLDITHYENLTEEQRKQIEELSNRVVFENREVIKKTMTRKEAEDAYGFRIYQGGAVPATEIRIVEIKDWDIEACGGTHVNSTREIEKIKILRSKKIQDGVVRIEFVAGKKAIEEALQKEREEHLKKVNALIKKITALNPSFKFSKESIEELESILKKELKKKRKEKKELNFEAKEGVNFIDTDNMGVLQKIGREFVEKNKDKSIILIGRGVVFGIKGEDSKVEVKEAVEKAVEVFGGKAGTVGREVKGGGKLREKAEEAFKKAEEVFKK